ncbi:MAG: glycosyltransferase, partial [Gemmatimonadaceae bacterium]
MNPHRSRYWLALLIGLVTMTVAVISVAQLLARVEVIKDDWALFIAVSLLLIFLILLVIRYFVLMWLGFLHHMEEQTAADLPRDAILPPVTIIVPAYNEGAVIEGAIRSLLEVDYPAAEILIVDDGSTDNTREVVSALEGRYGDLTVRLVGKVNGGK